MGDYHDRNHAHKKDGSDGSHPIEYDDLVDPPSIPRTAYGIVPSVVRASATSLTVGAGLELMIDGEPCRLLVATTVARARSNASEVEYLVATPDGAGGMTITATATAPAYSAALGYWTDGAGGRSIMPWPKDPSGNYYDADAKSDGANAVVFSLPGPIVMRPISPASGAMTGTPTPTYYTIDLTAYGGTNGQIIDVRVGHYLSNSASVTVGFETARLTDTGYYTIHGGYILAGNFIFATSIVPLLDDAYRYRIVCFVNNLTNAEERLLGFRFRF